MDNAKKAEFVRHMGKKFLRLRKGGVVQNFDGGGTVLQGPGTGGVNPQQGLVANIGSALGLTPQAANIQAGTNTEQLNNAYTGAQNAINAQVGLTNTLAPQAAGAVANQNAIAAQEAAMARGEGPNPAANQLAQATGANVANQAALMAGQRGASANPALLARQAAMQGAGIQQNAAGQAATMGSQQQIAAQNNLANLTNNQINQAGTATTALNTAAQNEQGALLGTNSNYNNTAAGMQENMNNNNPNKGLLGGISSALGMGPAIAGIFGAEGGEVTPEGFQSPNHDGHKKLDFIHNMAKLGLKHFEGGGPVQPSPTPNPPAAGSDTPILKKSIRNAFGFAEGGQVPASNWAGQYMQGSNAGIAMPTDSSMPQGVRAPAATNVNVVKSDKVSSPNWHMQSEGTVPGTNGTVGVFRNSGAGSGIRNAGGFDPGEGAAPIPATSLIEGPMADPFAGGYALGGNVMAGPHKSHVANYLAEGGMAKKVPAMVSPGEVYLSPEQVKKVIHEGANPLKIGQKFGGKAKVKGDSLKNDTIPVGLEEGGVVIDRKNVMSPERAELFVHRAIARHKAGGKK